MQASLPQQGTGSSYILLPDKRPGFWESAEQVVLLELMDLLEDRHKRGLIKDLTHQMVPRISVRMCPSVDVLCSHLSNWPPMSHLLLSPVCRELLPPIVLPCCRWYFFHSFCDL